MHNYKLKDKVYHPCDTAPFIVTGIRENEIEIRGDWSGGTNNIDAPSWVKIEDVKPYDESKVKYYSKQNIYVERLAKEWRTHGKIVLSVDFDSTLYLYPTIDNQKDIDRTIRLVQLAHSIGAYIVIFTASEKERFQFIQEYCDSIKIPVSSINENPIDLPYGKNGKIFYNINICDRSGINSALDILEGAIDEMQKEKIN